MQLALTLLQFRDVSSALGQHGLLPLQGNLQLQVLLVGALTDLSGTTELLLQGGRLKNEGGGERESADGQKTTKGEIVDTWLCKLQHLVVLLQKLHLKVLL